jgi:hypothetical protein
MKNSKYTKFINKLKNLNIPIDEYKLPIIVNISNILTIYFFILI